MRAVLKQDPKVCRCRLTAGNMDDREDSATDLVDIVFLTFLCNAMTGSDGQTQSLFVVYLYDVCMLRKPADRLGRVVFANEVSIRGCGGWSFPRYHKISQLGGV